MTSYNVEYEWIEPGEPVEPDDLATLGITQADPLHSSLLHALAELRRDHDRLAMDLQIAVAQIAISSHRRDTDR